jgi:hypothetical protein
LDRIDQLELRRKQLKLRAQKQRDQIRRQQRKDQEEEEKKQSRPGIRPHPSHSPEQVRRILDRMEQRRKVAEFADALFHASFPNRSTTPQPPKTIPRWDVT